MIAVTRYVALLRGINVGGRNKVAMADLRAAATGWGGVNVRTHGVSGNLALDSDLDPRECAAGLREVFGRELGLTTPVIVRSRERLVELAAGSPLGATATDPSRTLVGFLSAAPSMAAVARAEELIAARRAKGRNDSGDDYRLIGAELHLWCSVNVHASLFATINWDKALGVEVTMRNIAVVGTLAEL